VADVETLVLVGVADAAVVYGPGYRLLNLLLKNRRDDVDVVSAANGRHSVFLRLQPVSSVELARCVDDPSWWAGMDVFALRLRGLSVDLASLSSLENLGAVEARNVQRRSRAGASPPPGPSKPIAWLRVRRSFRWPTSRTPESSTSPSAVAGVSRP
jgi:hypothetical protein